MIKKLSLNIQEPRGQKSPAYTAQLLVALKAHCSLIKIGATLISGGECSPWDLLREDLDKKTRYGVANCDLVAIEHVLKTAYRATSLIHYSRDDQTVVFEHRWYGKWGRLLATMTFEIDQSLSVYIQAWRSRVLTSDS